LEEAKIIYLMNLPLTDAGNANRLHSLLGDDWKFVPQLGRWLHWNGQRWQEETNGSIRVAAMEAFRNLAADIRSLPSCHDMKEMQHRQKVADGLGRADSIGRIRGDLSFLEGLALKQYGEFDTDPFLLNLQNGTLNLSTGELRPHNKKDFITKICGASYESQSVAKNDSRAEKITRETVSSTGDTTAKESGMNVDILSENNSATSLWEETVCAILHDPAVRRWMQKFMGYCLTGSTEEEKFVVAYGPGGCGKGTFFETVAAAMGDYKAVVPVDILLTSNVYNGGNNPTPELAKLPGKRYVLSSESNKNRRMDEAKVKLLTGGDTLTARHLHADPFEFHPSFKLVLQTNYLPSISDAMDKGIRRRLVIVPFTAEIEKRDPKLKQKLLQPENQQACLAWCVEGAKLWQQEGLEDFPTEMQKAANSFYEESDLLQQWLDERTEHSLGFLKFDRALKDFNEWLATGGNSFYQRKSFSEAMQAHGKIKTRRETGYCFAGLCLKSS
jgi:putative DNA primase/helicase